MVHHTAGLGTAKGVVSVLNRRGLGIQWVVDLDGKIYRTLPAGSFGAHVGNNSRNRKVSNSNTEGVEVIGKDDADIKKRHDEDISNEQPRRSDHEYESNYLQRPDRKPSPPLRLHVGTRHFGQHGWRSDSGTERRRAQIH